MSKIALSSNTSGTGVFTLVSPGTNTNQTLTLPDITGTLVSTDSSGNVGIGTTSPTEVLQVVGGNLLIGTDSGDAFNNHSKIRIQGTGDEYIQLKSDGTGQVGLLFGDTTDDFTAGILSLQTAGNDLSFFANNATRMTIDNAGNVGIGTTAPAGRLHARFDAGSGDGHTAKYIFQSLDQRLTIGTYYEAGVAQNARIQSSSGSGVVTSLILNPDGGNVGIGTTAPGRKLDVTGIIRSDGTSGAFALGGNSSTPAEGAAIHRPAADTLAFVTASTERMRIYSDGTVGIFNLAGAGSRTVTAGSGGVLAAASDSRLKQEVPTAPIPGLAEIMRLEPRAYKWLDDIENRGEDASVEIGFFANEVKDIISSAAPMGNDGYYGFYDRAVIAALTKAVQEQQAIITQQAADITSLTDRITALESTK